MPYVRTDSAAVGGGSGAARAVAAASSRGEPVELLAPNLLRTSRMILRPLRESDREGFLRMIRSSESELKKWVHPHREGESDEELFVRHLALCREGEARGIAARRVAILDDGRIAGCFNLNSISRGLVFEADFAWWIATDLWGQGLGTEAAQAMLDLAFLDLPRGLGLHRVQAAIHPINERSLRMALRLGFKLQEGARVSVRVGDRWEAHDLYARSLSV
ncbi:MAG: GNAT family N-acetyltransferase [Phycisphaerales bacterium]